MTPLLVIGIDGPMDSFAGRLYGPYLVTGEGPLMWVNMSANGQLRKTAPDKPSPGGGGAPMGCPGCIHKKDLLHHGENPLLTFSP